MFLKDIKFVTQDSGTFANKMSENNFTMMFQIMDELLNFASIKNVYLFFLLALCNETIDTILYTLKNNVSIITPKLKIFFNVCNMSHNLTDNTCTTNYLNEGLLSFTTTEISKNTCITKINFRDLIA